MPAARDSSGTDHNLLYNLGNEVLEAVGSAGQPGSIVSESATGSSIRRSIEQADKDANTVSQKLKNRLALRPVYDLCRTRVHQTVAMLCSVVDEKNALC